MSEKRKHPYVWVKWLSKIMAGEQACLWASWFKAHHQSYAKADSDFDLTSWHVKHTRLSVTTCQEFTRRGATVRVEGQNYFRWPHASGGFLAGKPDIVSIEDTAVTVVDCKTGTARRSDRIQVQIYMHVLPFCFPELGLKTIKGRVVYADNQVEIPPDAADGRFGEDLDFFMGLVAGETAPMAAPSSSECRFCDITPADCPSRVSVKPQEKLGVRA
jgi:hypothetical protein